MAHSATRHAGQNRRRREKQEQECDDAGEAFHPISSICRAISWAQVSNDK